MSYSLSDFDFTLPEELIAQQPASPRDHARLLVYDRRTKKLTDDYFYSLPQYLPASTTLVINNSKVEKCRLAFDNGMEVFVLETHNPTAVTALVRPGRKFKLGAEVTLASGLVANVTAISEDGLRTLALATPLDDPAYDPYRLTPLPPYIGQYEALADEYQTVYARPEGSKAAPTAGLHFTEQLLERIKASHAVVEVTLHVGLGTFAPVKSDDLSSHIMHSETFYITTEAAAQLQAATHRTAVGTTSVRTIESAFKPFRAQHGDTEIFITPGYDFTATDALITNFHLPKSTLLMLVSAFIGGKAPVEELHRIYAHAIAKGYRFYSFGDAMLIL